MMTYFEHLPAPIFDVMYVRRSQAQRGQRTSGSVTDCATIALRLAAFPNKTTLKRGVLCETRRTAGPLYSSTETSHALTFVDHRRLAARHQSSKVGIMRFHGDSVTLSELGVHVILLAADYINTAVFCTMRKYGGILYYVLVTVRASLNSQRHLSILANLGACRHHLLWQYVARVFPICWGQTRPVGASTRSGCPRWLFR
jgi:hypothetical protein